MFNEERKLRFLKTERQSKEYGISIFNTTEEAEVKYGKDLCELEATEIQWLFEEHFGFRKRAADSAAALMRAYAQWCKANGYTVSNGVFEIVIDYKDKLRRKMVANPTQLEAILDDIFEPVDSRTVDCLYRCYLWMAFSGLRDYDSINVLVADIDLQNNLIHFGDSDYEIFNQSRSSFQMACEANSFVYIHNNPRYETLRARSAGDRLLRGVRGDFKLATVRASVKHRLTDHNYDLSYSRIRLSGLFYKAYEAERAGFQFDFNPFVIEQLESKTRSYTQKYTKSKVAYAIRKDLLDDYARWKEAFDVK